MTVSSETNRSGPFNGNGVTTAFDYEFRITNEAYVRVIKNVDGAETTLTLGVDYTVTGVGNDGGGQVICTVAPATGETITNILNIPFTQELDLENQGAYNAQDVEDALDLAAQRDLQLQEQLDRALVIPASADASQLDGLIEDVLRLADSADEVDTVAGIAAQVVAVAAVADDLAGMPALVANAQTAATNAATSATNAAASETLAGKYANNPEDVEITPGSGLFSAFHWYRKALAIYNAVVAGFSAAIHAATAKTSLVSADEFGIWDSVSGALRKITYGNLILAGSQLQGKLQGLTLSNNAADAANDIDIAVGNAAAGSSPYPLMQLSSAMTKQLDATFVAGTNQGMREIGPVLADGWWFIYLIQRSDTGAVDVLASVSSGAPAMPANYDRKRLIGAIYRTGGAIKAFVQYPNRGVVWVTPAVDFNSGTLSTTGALLTLTVPPIAGVEAHIGAFLNDATGGSVFIRESAQVNDALGTTNADLSVSANAQRAHSDMTRFVDGSGQVRYKSNVASMTLLRVETRGFTLPN